MKKSANKERRAEAVKSLKEVAEFIKTIPDEQFNMGHWWLEDGKAFDDDRGVVYKVADGPCGCVIGHLIHRGLLGGEVLKPDGLGPDALPYQFSDRVFVQISDALKIYNYKIAEFLFSQYSYERHWSGEISRDVVINRINFICSELEGA